MEISNNKKMAPKETEYCSFEESLFHGKVILQLLCKEYIEFHFLLKESPLDQRSNHLTQIYFFIDLLKNNFGHSVHFLYS